MSNKILQTLAASWQPSTLRTYASGLLNFHVFCDKNNVPEHLRAPCHPNVIAAFISSLAGLYAGSTVRNYVAGIKAWHLIHRVKWSTSDAEVNHLMKAADNLAPASSKRAKRDPFTIKQMEVVRKKLDLSVPLDAAVFACLTASFYACARLGEFTVLSTASFKSDVHVTPKSLRLETDRKGNQVQVIFIPKTKTAPKGEDVAFATQIGSTDPCAALRNHLEINSPADGDHLFSYRTSPDSNTRLPLTRTKFLDRLTKIFKQEGFSPPQGHSLRIGGTLEYLLRGVSFETVKHIGRWRSEAFRAYLREHAQILAPYLQDASTIIHAAFVQFIS